MQADYQNWIENNFIKTDSTPRKNGEWWSISCPFHQPDRHPSFSINISTGGWKDHHDGNSGNIFQLAKQLGIDLPRENKISTIKKVYSYCDESGKELYQVVRKLPKEFYYRQRKNGNYIYKVKGIRRVLYRLPEIIDGIKEGKRIHIVEGEKDVETLREKGLIATTNPMGASESIGKGKNNKWKASYTNTLKSAKDVVIIADSDEPGLRHAHNVANSLVKAAISVKVVKLYSQIAKKHGKDVSDWFEEGHTIDELTKIIKHTEQWSYKEETPEQVPNSDEIINQNISHGELLTRLCEQNVKEFFRDQFNQPHVIIPVGDHDEILSTKQSKFKERVLSKLFRAHFGSPPSERALKQARIMCESFCDDGQQRELFNRVGWYEGVLYYDLSNSKHQGVRITSEGWEIVPIPPIFRRYNHQTEQVLPVKSELDLREVLFQFCNVIESDKILFLITFLSWFIPDIPHPIIVLTGEQGSAKSTTCKLMKSLIDPSAVLLKSKPKDDDTAKQWFDHHWFLPLDNLSGIPIWLSDFLCRCVTGEGSSKRTLYTNDEDFIRSYRRCVAINGIGIVPYKGDLLDRSIIIETPILQKVVSERRMVSDFERKKPEILGTCFSILSEVLKEKEDPIFDETYYAEFRMADFAEWGVYFAAVTGYGALTFQQVYRESIQCKVQDSAESSPLIKEIMGIMENRMEWTGTAQELLDLIPSNDNPKLKDVLPRLPNALTRKLKETAPIIRKCGIDIIFHPRKTNRREISLIRIK